MKYQAISPVQHIEIGVSTFLFLILFGFIRNMMMQKPLDAKNIIFLTIFFFITFYLTRFFTNMVMSYYIAEKLNPYEV